MTELQQWTRPDSYAGREWNGWIVAPVDRNRDSDILTESNWDVFTADLDKLVESSKILSGDWTDPISGEECGPYEIVHEHHWACGWVEWIAVHPDAADIVKYSEDTYEALEAYPVLDEDAFCEAEHEAAYEQFKYESGDMRAAMIESMPTLEETIEDLTEEQLWSLYWVADLPEPYTSDNGGTYVFVRDAAAAITPKDLHAVSDLDRRGY